MTPKNYDSDTQTMPVLLLLFNMQILFSCIHLGKNSKRAHLHLIKLGWYSIIPSFKNYWCILNIQSTI